MFFSQNSQVGNLQFPKLGLLSLWMRIIFYANKILKWGLKQICSPCWELSNDMWHASCTHIIQGDYRLLVVESQINTLTLDPSFGHNLCCKYSNRSCKLILNIYFLRNFEWYNKVLNLMSFDPSSCYLKIQKLFGISTSKVCRFIPSHSPTFQGMWMWLPSCILGLHLFIPLLWRFWH